mmetsp:Transcript_15648/g.24289  ORF Transcript_15648/g.24289 Transcript_15648/m.24289 type:complete len:509 (+) Transcript_15648:71-1597(+)
MSKLSTTLSASLDALPNTIVAASILPFVNSTALLHFRLASRGCYEICHGHVVGSTAAQQQHEEESEALWCLALVRDYRFVKGDELLSMYKSIRCNPDPEDETNPFLSTSDVFTASSAFISWKHWRKIDSRLHHDENGRLFLVSPSAQLVGPYFLRAASLWREIEQWCSDESMSENLGPAIQSNLRPGKPVGAFLVEGGYQDGKLSAFKAVYSFYSGQNMNLISSGRLLTGLFGGYSVYDTLSHNCWCPPEVLSSGWDLIVAQDINNMKMTVFDARSGDVVFLISSPHQFRRTTIKTKAVLDGSDDDQILRWFENHADNLNKYSVGTMAAGSVESILRYPSLNDSTNCSRAVTRGVEVVASSTYVKELGGLFVYSIRMRLLQPEDGEDYMSPEERGFDTCQLVSRYWRITQGGEVEEVRGEGVIGCYPLLREGDYQNFISEDGGHTFHDEWEDHGGGKYFSYQSCTHGEGGEMEGYLQFKAGSIQEEAGEVFDVRVAPFPLELPQHYQY